MFVCRAEIKFLLKQNVIYRLGKCVAFPLGTERNAALTERVNLQCARLVVCSSRCKQFLKHPAALSFLPINFCCRQTCNWNVEDVLCDNLGSVSNAVFRTRPFIIIECGVYSFGQFIIGSRYFDSFCVSVSIPVSVSTFPEFAFIRNLCCALINIALK